MLGKFFRKLKNFFFPSKKQRIKEYYEKKGITPEERKKYLREVFRRKFQELKGKVDKLKDTIRKQDEVINKLRGEIKKKEKRKAEVLHETVQKQKERKRFALWFNDDLPIVSGVTNNQYFTDGQYREWRHWSGIMFEKTPNGVGFKLLLTDPEIEEGKKVAGLPDHPLPIQLLPRILPETFVKNAKIGGPIPIMLTKQGDFVPSHWRVSKERIRESKRKMKKRQEIRQKIKYFKQIKNIELEEINNKIKQLKERTEQEEKPPDEVTSKLKQLKKKKEDRKNLTDEEIDKKISKLRNKLEGMDEGEMIEIDLRGLLKNADSRTRRAMLALWNKYHEERNQRMRAERRAKKNLIKKKEAEITADSLDVATKEAISSLAKASKSLNSIIAKYSSTLASGNIEKMKVANLEQYAEEQWKMSQKLRERISESKLPREKKKEILEDIKEIETLASPIPSEK